LITFLDADTTGETVGNVNAKLLLNRKVAFLDVVSSSLLSAGINQERKQTHKKKLMKQTTKQIYIIVSEEA
jgi:alpha-D-ribose 1-methylphosphonate 5-triphosphate synthase subunit PhnL